jgi:SulP family sulfate permease
MWRGRGWWQLRPFFCLYLRDALARAPHHGAPLAPRKTFVIHTAPARSRFSEWKGEWFFNIRRDLLSGITVALALIPEAIAFSVVAGVPPKVGLYASFIIAVTTAIFGGRTGMISAATGAIALVAVPLVKAHGLQYFLAASILAGVIQLVFRGFRLSRYIRFVPRSVMTGFVNALGILIFAAQIPQMKGATPLVYALIAAGLAIIYLFPRLTKAVPAPLVAIVSLTAITLATGAKVPTVGDMGELPSTLPTFHIPEVPFTLAPLRTILPYSFAMAMVGLIESLLTASVIDDLTDTPSCKHTEAHGQGIANILSGFFGGMAGCAMIGQSGINVRSGGRGRLSTFSAGVFLLILVVVLGPLVQRIPTASLIAVMITVAIGTFDWSSLRAVKRMPVSETLVMFGTVLTVLATHDLSIGVFVGVVMSSVFFARNAGKLFAVEKSLSIDGTRVYQVRGQLFFVAVEQFAASFDYQETISEVEIDLSQAHVWDSSAVAAIDRVVLKLREKGATVHLSGMNAASEGIVEKLAIHRVPGATLAGH